MDNNRLNELLLTVQKAQDENTIAVVDGLQNAMAEMQKQLPAGVRLGYKTWLPYNTIVLYGDPEAGERFARATTASPSSCETSTPLRRSGMSPFCGP